MRQLVTPRGTWRYMVGRLHVRLVAPNGKARVVAAHEIVGVSPTEWERGQWKGYSSVKPWQVRQYVDRL